MDEFRPGHDLAPIALGAVPRYTLDGGAVAALDEQLSVVRRRHVDVPYEGRLLAATPDLTTVVLGARDHLRVQSGDRVLEVGIEAPDSAVILADGRLLVTAPVVEQREHHGRPYETKGEHLAHLVDAGTGSVVDRAVLEVVDAGVFAIPHPHDGTVLLDAGMGQNGSTTFRARVSGDHLAVEQLWEDVVLSGFDPSGGRLLLMPHPSFADTVRVVNWPDLHEMAVLSGAELEFADGGIDLYGCFLSEERVVLQASEAEENGLLVCTADLTPVAWLDLDPPGGELSSFMGVGPDLIVAEVWVDGEGTSTVWRVPRENFRRS